MKRKSTCQCNMTTCSFFTSSWQIRDELTSTSPYQNVSLSSEVQWDEWDHTQQELSRVKIFGDIRKTDGTTTWFIWGHERNLMPLENQRATYVFLQHRIWVNNHFVLSRFNQWTNASINETRKHQMTATFDVRLTDFTNFYLSIKLDTYIQCLAVVMTKEM